LGARAIPARSSGAGPASPALGVFSTVELNNGHSVMVSVDAYELWEPAHDYKDDPDHSSNLELVVTGIDTTNGLVYLNDSGSPSGQHEVIPLNRFEAAWEASNTNP
jgi:hypothetical protein